MKPEVSKFIDLYGVNRACVPIKANKDGEIRATLESLCEVILYLMNPINHPVYIHCNRGKHRTGCVIACLRKCQLWPIDEIFAEYETYAGDKARPEDKQLIRAFNPVDVFKYAQTEKMLETWPSIQRKDSVMHCDPADIFDLCSWLPAHKTSLIPGEDDDDMSDNDDGIQIARRVLRANHKVNEAEQMATVADVDLLEKESSEQLDDEAVHVEEVDNIDPQLATANDGMEESARYDWSSVKKTQETADNAVFPSNSPPLSVSPVRARAAA